MPKKTARRIIDTKKATGTTIISGVTVSGSPGAGASAAMAGDGLTYNSGVLDVGAGTLITVGADSVGITAGSTYQYIGTGAGTAAAWQNLSGLAGAGLTHAAGVLAVGAGNGITVNADDVALTTPGTLTASTSNSASNNHTHAVTTGAASTLSVATSNATGSSASLARADHLHTITSSADVTGGGTSLLASSAGNLKLATGNIGSTLGYNGTFTSGFAGAGWRVDYGVTEASKASATFDNLTVRGRMRVYELLIQQIRATNGSELVSSSSKIFTVSASTDPLWTVNGSQLTFNGSNATLTTTIYTITTSDSTEAGASRTHYHGFLVGDLIRAQQMQWDGSGFAGVIQSDLEVTGVTNLYSYTAARVSTANDEPAVGYDYVRIGSASNTTRQGVVYLTSDDDNAPFIDIVDGVASHAQWNTAGKIRARLGRLDGITDAQWGTLSGYGLWSDNVYLTGSIYARDGVFQGTVYASAGSFTGSVTASSGTIGGWNIGATALTAGSGSSTVGLDTGGTNPAIYAGSATPGSAPFRVTQAGALTASNATITGAITANSGSIDGFLTIGTSGGIYQGSGTFASPTTGLKIYNSGGIGYIATWQSGTKTFRIGDDDVRYLITSNFDDVRTVKWLDNIDFSGTWSDLASEAGQYSFVGGYKDTNYNYLHLSSRVNDTGSPANTRGAQIALAAVVNHSGTVKTGSLIVGALNSTYNYDGIVSITESVLQLYQPTNAPTVRPSSSNDAMIYIRGGKFIIMYNDAGTTRWKYLTLSGTGVTWTHTTTAP